MYPSGEARRLVRTSVHDRRSSEPLASLRIQKVAVLDIEHDVAARREVDREFYLCQLTVRVYHQNTFGD